MKKKKKTKKTVILSPKDANLWFETANLFAKSLLSMQEAIGEYNKLSPGKRANIKKTFCIIEKQHGSECLKDSSQKEKEEHYIISVLVDAHIVAADYNTDPIVVLMCINPPCLLSQKVVVR